MFSRSKQGQIIKTVKLSTTEQIPPMQSLAKKTLHIGALAGIKHNYVEGVVKSFELLNGNCADVLEKKTGGYALFANGKIVDEELGGKLVDLRFVGEDPIYTISTKNDELGVFNEFVKISGKQITEKSPNARAMVDGNNRAVMCRDNNNQGILIRNGGKFCIKDIKDPIIESSRFINGTPVISLIGTYKDTPLELSRTIFSPGQDSIRLNGKIKLDKTLKTLAYFKDGKTLGLIIENRKNPWKQYLYYSNSGITTTLPESFVPYIEGTVIEIEFFGEVYQFDATIHNNCISLTGITKCGCFIKRIDKDCYIVSKDISDTELEKSTEFKLKNNKVYINGKEFKQSLLKSLSISELLEIQNLGVNDK